MSVEGLFKSKFEYKETLDFILANSATKKRIRENLEMRPFFISFMNSVRQQIDTLTYIRYNEVNIIEAEFIFKFSRIDDEDENVDNNAEEYFNEEIEWV